MTVLVAASLVALVVVTGLATIGALTAGDAFDRLHFPGPVAMVGGTALVVAAVADGVPLTMTVRIVLVVVLLQLATVVTTHATARAGLVRGDLARERGRHDEVVEP